MGLNRRDFLKQTGGVLAGLGASDLGLSLLSQQYGQVLAEPTRRKLALLVGINQYRQVPLNGCVTDVDLQRELLIHRFGWQPQDILTLTDQQATRTAIATAFMEHLIGQAKTGDVVVFHFSGYGGSVSLGSDATTIQPSLVPVDDLLADGDLPIVNDLLTETLGLLVRSLPTDKVTTILDTSHAFLGKSLQGNLRIRARPLVTAQSGNADLALQQQLRNQKPFHATLPGALLAAAAPGQLATEARWSGLSAGLFTYALTRHLWHTTAATTLRFSMQQVREQVEQLARQEQQPQLRVERNQTATLSPYFLNGVPVTGADGVVIGVEEGGHTAKLWLAGLPATIIEQYGANSLLTLVNETQPGLAPVYLQVLTRDGLSAKARIYRADMPPDAIANLPVATVGQFVRERVRVLPRNVGLVVALDSSLDRIERVDAISAFTAIPRVSSAIAGEQAADYLFSKISTPPPTQVATTNLTGVVPPTSGTTPSSYGLFSLGQEAIPNTAGESGEAVKVAIRRLVPKLQTLLAVKLLNLTVNDGASQIAVRATLEKVESQIQPLLQQETLAWRQRSRNSPLPPTNRTGKGSAEGLLPLAAGSRIQFRLENDSDRPLYYLVLGSDSNGNLMVFYTPSGAITVGESTTTTIATSAAIIATGETVTLPPTIPTFQWLVRGPDRLVETFLLCSRAPFTQTLTAITASLHPVGNTAALYTVPNPLDVAQAVLQDLHQASDPAAQVAGAPPETWALDMDAWASLRFVYQVV